MNQMKTQHSIATARALNMIYDHSARARARTEVEENKQRQQVKRRRRKKLFY